MQMRAALLAFAAWSVFTLSPAQTITSSMTGTVTDASGAVAPGVTIKAVNVGTNATNTAETNEAGLYSFPFLPVGSYKITAEKTGFKTASLGPFDLLVNQTARVDVAMQVGQTTETINVDASAPVLQTESVQTGDVITSRKLQELPLNGRNFASLTLLIPGAIATNPNDTNTATRYGGGGRPFVNGNREQTNNFLLDGVDINDSMDNRIGYSPSVDALQEVQVITGNGNAEFGNSAGAVVNSTIKSGTNEFHGNVFEFFRNQLLDANGFFRNRTTNLPKDDQRRAFRQNIFGGTIGGPIKRNKIFFFADFEGTRRRDSGPAQTSVAPLDFRQGNLSRLAPIRDPATCVVTNGTRTCQNFPGNQIPLSRFSPVARALFSDPALYPLPNTTGSGTLGLNNNYTGTSANFLDNNQGDVKVDFRPTDKDSLFGRYTQSDYRDGASGVLVPTTAAGLNEAPTKGAVLAWTRTLSPTIVNDARFGFTRTVIINDFSDLGGLGTSGNQRLGIAGAQPTVGISSITLGEGIATIGTAGVLSDGKDNKFHLSETLSVGLGRHFLKFGANGVRYQQNRFYSGNNGALGTFTYSGDYTGSVYGDFLIDALNGKGRGQADRRRWGQRHWRSGLFVQDDFRVRPNLTVNLGLRWEYTQPLVEVNDLQSNIGLVNGQISLAGKNGNSRALYNAYYKQFMPRVGFAWTPGMFGNKLVVRAGYGITSFLEGTGVNLRLPLNPPFFFESNITYDLNNPSSITRGFADLPTFNGQLAGNVRIWNPDLRPQFTQQFNVSLEYQLSQSLSLNTAYVGQRATHTIVARDTNQPLPGVGDPANWAPLQQRRPLYASAPGITTTATTESSGTMSYDSLQVTARQRFRNGFDFIASYTFSKTLEDALGFFGAGGSNNEGAYWQNAYDRHANHGPAPWDARHNFNFGGSYQIPFGRGLQFGGSTNRAVDFVLGGWSVRYILSTHSGLPITIQGLGRSNQAGRGTQRPNRLREFTYENQSIDNWFGTGNKLLCAPGVDDGKCAYQDPVLGTFGNSGIGTERAPHYFNLDSSIGKKFNVTEQRYFDFRAEFFNTLNYVSFGQPARNITATGTFGNITSQLNNPRNIQLGLKFYF